MAADGAVKETHWMDRGSFNDEIIEWLQETGTPEGVASLGRYGIPDDNALGVPMGIMKKKAKSLGQNHAVALELWETGFLRSPDHGGVHV